MKLDDQLARYQQAARDIVQNRRRLEELEVHLQNVERAQSVAQEVAKEIQSEAHQKIAAIVTRCLSIFDSPYTFEIRFRQSRGKTEAKMVFLRNGHEVDPISSSGGGVVSVAAFALRLSAIVLQPDARRLLVLDEPFGHLSGEYTQDVSDVLQALSEELGIQIVMVTHNRGLKLGKVLEV